MKAVAILVVLTGCFSKPDPPGGVCGTQPSAPGLVLDLGEAPVVTFAGGNASLGFANDQSRYPMPVSLRINGRELVAAPEACNLEDQVGIAVYPVYSISGNDTVSPGSGHALDREVVGPAFTRLRTTWQFRYPNCNVVPTMATGSTLWSLFPDGRIVRNDFLIPAQNGSVGLTMPGCRCSSAASANYFVLTSYFALETSVLTSVTTSNDDAESTTGAPVVGSLDRDVPAACARAQGDGRVAFRWDLAPEPPARYPSRIRTEQSAGGHTETAFVYDMVADSNPTLTNQIPIGMQYGARTHMLVDGSNTRTCIEMADDVGAYADANTLRVSGLPVSNSAQGVFDDAAITGRAHTEPVVLEATGGTIFGGFVVGVRFPGVSAIRTSPQTTGVVWQREADDLFYVLFPEPLLTGSSLTITPEC